MQKMYIVTLCFATNQKVSAIKMLRAFFSSLGLADAKQAVEKMLEQELCPSQYFAGKEVSIGVTAEEYAAYWVGAKPDMFGDCRVRNIQPIVLPAYFRP